MNAGPGGFADAPVTKAIFLASAAASILANAGRGNGGASSSADAASVSSVSSLPPLLRPFAFASTGEMLTGLAMLYSQRLLERQSGSAQYGAQAAFVAGAAYAAQLALSLALGGGGASSSSSSSSSSASLPLAFAFAGLVPFAADVPPQARFTFLGVPCTDKLFAWLAAAHAVWAAGLARGLVAAAAGIAAGLLYRLNAFGVRHLKLRLPRWLGGGGSAGGASSSPPPPRVLVPPVLDPAAAALAAGGFQRAGAGGPEQLQPQQMMRRRR